MEVSCDFMPIIEQDVSEILIRFREWYENRNILQEEIANQLGITKWHLSKVLNQRTMPSFKLLNKMEKLMKNGA